MGFAFKLAKVEKSVRTIPETIYNPYLAARHEWDERYGDLVTRAKNWRTMALVSGLIALVATGRYVVAFGTFTRRAICCPDG